MIFKELARKRYSSRAYLEKPVDKEKIVEVLEAGRIAPSACNLQPWHFIVASDEETKAKVIKSYPRTWIKTAPVILVLCGDHSQSWKRGDGKDHCDVDVSIAFDHMTLAAAEMGLGTCWVCAFDAKVLSEALDRPDNIEPIAIMPLGYPSDSADPSRHDSRRKPLDEIVHWNRY